MDYEHVNETALKFCPGCQTEKSRSDFSKNKRRYDGLTNYCRVCWRQVSREQYLKNRDKIADKYRENTEAQRKIKRGRNAWEHVPCVRCGLNFRRQLTAEKPECLPCSHGREVEHGKHGTYVRGCRCEPCTKAASAAVSLYPRPTSSGCRPGNPVVVDCDCCGLKSRRSVTSEETTCRPCRHGKIVKHGTASTYTRGCRCRPCTDAASANAVRNRKRRFKELGVPDSTAYRKRCKKYGGSYGFVNRKIVYDRDGWVCQLCGEPVDRSSSFPDPYSVSLDHVVPLALGGNHSYENTQCSHLRCNQRKQHRV